MTDVVVETSREPSALAGEEILRAGIYHVLARFLAAPPDQLLLDAAAQLSGDGTALGRATTALAEAAQTAKPDDLAREYQDLFIGLVRGELVPFASFYLTGFLYERPLASLRETLRHLGVERAEGTKEPEDHIAAELEVLAGLITGSYGADNSLAAQREFFETYLAPWAPRFFADLERARGARFYALVGTFGRIFLDIEATAFAMVESVA